MSLCRPEVFDAAHLISEATKMGLVLSDDDLAFLQRLDSVDVQAAPGSGKTTLTSFKLCIMASGWLDKRRGICVLSHTNTAKNQIRSFVSRHTNGEALLRYPHFVGTIQSFVDEFLAFPHLHSCGLRPNAPDDEAFARAADRLLELGEFSKLRNTLGNKHNGSALLHGLRYFFRSGAVEISSAAGDLKFSLSSPSGQQLVKLKSRLLDRGVLRFDDMFAFAQEYLTQQPAIRQALSFRFPFVLIDEMQDTDTLQESVLTLAFDQSDTRIQRIGDLNQRIFAKTVRDTDFSTFPLAGALELGESRRFGPNVAAFASLLTVNRPQQIRAAPGARDNRLLALLFDEGSASKVLDEFAGLVHKQASEQQQLAVKALGARRESSGSPFPSGIYTYVSRKHLRQARRRSAERLLDFACDAQQLLVASSTSHESCAVLWNGVAALLRRWESTGTWLTVPRIKSRANELPRESHIQIKLAMSQMLEADLESESEWDECSRQLMEALIPLATGGEPTDSVFEFVGFEAQIDEDEFVEGIEQDQGNKWKEFGLTCDTIHGTKGETHFATLMLECPDRQVYDLKEVIAVIVGHGDTKRMQKPAVKDALMRAFVAFTRPTNTLGIALLKEHAESFIEPLKTQGWEVLDLT